MRFVSWIPKSTNTHSGYIILTALPLHERAYNVTLHVQYNACLVIYFHQRTAEESYCRHVRHSL